MSHHSINARGTLLVVASPRASFASASSSMQMWCGCVPCGAFSRWLMSMLRGRTRDELRQARQNDTRAALRHPRMHNGYIMRTSVLWLDYALVRPCE